MVLACSEAVIGLCAPAVEECIQVLGPANATLEYVDRVDPAENFYHVLISWEVGTVRNTKPVYIISASYSWNLGRQEYVSEHVSYGWAG